MCKMNTNTDMNSWDSSDVAEVEELSEREFTHHTDSVGISTFFSSSVSSGTVVVTPKTFSSWSHTHFGSISKNRQIFGLFKQIVESGYFLYHTYIWFNIILEVSNHACFISVIIHAH